MTNKLATAIRFVHLNICKFEYSLGGHGMSLVQTPVFELDPWHCAPPLEGGGLVHVLVRDRCPPPQVTEHEVQEPHVLHTPSTRQLAALQTPVFELGP